MTSMDKLIINAVYVGFTLRNIIILTTKIHVFAISWIHIIKKYH